MTENRFEFFKGKKVQSFPESNIFEGFPYNFFEVVDPVISEQEEKVVKLLQDFFLKKASLTELEKHFGKLNSEEKKVLEETSKKIEEEKLFEKLPSSNFVKKFKVDLLPILTRQKDSIKNIATVVNKIIDFTIGYDVLSPLMRETQLEEIMVNGENKNIFVYHRKFGFCKTNIFVPKHDGAILDLAIRISNYSSRKFSSQYPLLNARLPDGSRANATYPSITPFGTSLTIRKFSYSPISIIDLINNKTISSELAAFLWLMVEGKGIEPMNMIITGGTGSGKTTLLDALTTLIPYRERIISIEDTIEISLGERDNWIQMETHPPTREIPEVTMDDLLKNSLRMRPDRIIVGEVRGSEAETLFVAMDTGHKGIMGTLHSNNANEMIIRLKNPPMNVPEQMLPLLDLIVVTQRIFDREKGMIRRVSQVTEVSRMGEKVLLGNIFEFDPAKETIYRTDVPSHVMQELSEKTGLNKKALKDEIVIRQRILEWMQQQNISFDPDVEKIIQEYYFNEEAVLDKIAKT